MKQWKYVNEVDDTVMLVSWMESGIISRRLWVVITHILDIIYHCFRDEMKRIHAVSKSSSPCSLSFVLSLSSHIYPCLSSSLTAPRRILSRHTSHLPLKNIIFHRYCISVTVSGDWKICRMGKRKNELNLSLNIITHDYTRTRNPWMKIYFLKLKCSNIFICAQKSRFVL